MAIPETQTPVVAIVEPTQAPTLISQVAEDSGGGGLPLEALVGGAAILVILGYVWFYFQGLLTVERYAQGFIIERCPVCQRGHLHVETRTERVLGIPQARHTVRCDECRSVLRGTGDRQWRYAVDPLENAAMYQRYNGTAVTDDTLKALDQEPLLSGNPQPRTPTSPPKFVDEDDS